MNEPTTFPSSPAATRRPLRIAHVEISRFRRLHAVRLDLERDTTVLVGANNSGKTAALSAVRLFLRDRDRFNAYDIGAENWAALRSLGEGWAAMTQNPAEGAPDGATVDWAGQLSVLNDAMPSLDVWFDAQAGDYHHVAHLIPTLDWEGGLVGVRLRLEPAADVAELQKLAWAYRQARSLAQAACEQDQTAASRAWPTDLLDFWLRHPEKLSSVAAFKLDPAKLMPVDELYRARPQKLRADAKRLDHDLLQKVIRVDIVPAQRGLGSEEALGRKQRDPQPPGMFSQQLVELARSRFDAGPFEREGEQAMQVAVARAQASLDHAIGDALKDVTAKVRSLGYPGLHDPQELIFRSRVRTADLLNHGTAVQYSVDDASGATIHLPEHGIGLGYQNLQTLTYKLYGFREERLGRAESDNTTAPVPVHLVLMEEPEAHLHVQAQRVFVERAYELLMPDGADQELLSSQLVISTHSSHVAHALTFAQLRYLRRTPGDSACPVPTSAVIGWQDVFGDDEKDTQRFVERYLRIQHSDLLFADAAVFVEGAAERLLVPQFVERDWSDLACRYLSFIEVGGSHAHHFRPLVERLGIPVLILTDLDPSTVTTDSDGSTSKHKAPVTACHTQVSTNPTLTQWHPRQSGVPDLLALEPADKETPVASWSGIGAYVAFRCRPTA